MNKYIAAVFIVLAFAKAESIKAQSDLTDVLSDFLIVLDGYNEPAAEASVLQTGAGYYTTAKSLDLFEFNVGVGISGLPFPNRKQSFSVSDSQFRNFDIRDASSATIPTALGGEQRVFFDFEIDGEQYEFQAIGGLGTELFAFPYLQGQLGLWNETELTLRYGPQITIENSDYTLFGAGLKHNLSQYLFKDERSFELAVLVNYNTSDLNLRYDPIELAPASGAASIAVIKGSLIDFYSINAGLIGSKDVNNWTFSAGAIYSSSWIDYRIVGDQSEFLNLFNNVLQALSERRSIYRVDAGVAYNFNEWTIGSQVSVSQFVNFNLLGTYQVF
jgi:hypothetical protein